MSPTYVFYCGSLLGWFLLHFFFLSSDPGAHIGAGRDAWTDEGIYTSQVRNWINFGDLNLQENPTFFKTPFFGLMLSPFFYLFGTRIEVARLVILVFTTLVFLYLGLNKSNRNFYLLSVIILLSNLFIFTYSHLAMAEIPAILFVIMGIQQLHHLNKKPTFKKKVGVILISFLLFCLAFLTKAMFGYLLLYIPVILLLAAFGSFIRKTNHWKQFLRLFGMSLIFIFSFIALYACLWVFPQRSLAVKVWAYEAVGRFPSIGDIPGTIKFWIQNIYLNNSHVFYTVALLLIVFVSGSLVLIKKIRIEWTGFLLAIWLIIELHKLMLSHQPPRYQLSLIASIGFFISYLLQSIRNIKGKGWSWLVFFIISLFVINNSREMYWMYKFRTFQLQSANVYMQKFTEKGDVAIGPWAGSFCWNSKVYSIPVWGNYMNDRGIIARFDPSWIITEIDQDDANQAFKRDGVVLPPGKEFVVGGYIINVHHLN